MTLSKCPDCKIDSSGYTCAICGYPTPRQGGCWVGYNGARYTLWQISKMEE